MVRLALLAEPRLGPRLAASMSRLVDCRSMEVASRRARAAASKTMLKFVHPAGEAVLLPEARPTLVGDHTSSLVVIPDNYTSLTNECS